MGAQLRVYRQRIRDTQSTKKITHAMELISSSRIVKAQQAVERTRPYAYALGRALTLAASHANVDHPLLVPPKDPKRAAIVLISADRGLAGAYSANVIREAEQLASNLREHKVEPVNYIIGRKGVAFHKFRGHPIEASWTGFSDKPTFKDALQVSNAVLDAFTKGGEQGGVDAIHLVYTRWIDRGRQEPRVLRLVPLDVEEQVVGVGDSTITGGDDAGGKPVFPLYDFEPGASQVLDALLPAYVQHVIHVTLLGSAASEHAARQRAMKSATDNAEDMIRRYVRQANQARQAEITQEISEIVGGANALAEAH